MTPYYDRDGCAVYHGDSQAVLAALPEKSVQLVCTSPPYYAAQDYGQSPGQLETLPDYGAYIAQMQVLLRELYRVTDEDGRLALVVDDKHTSLKTHGENRNLATHARLIVAAESAGYVYKDLVVWSKMRGASASGGAGCMLGSFPYPPNIPVNSMFEYILLLRRAGRSRAARVSAAQKEASKLVPDEFRLASQGIWEVPAETKRSDHPCPYPLTIAARLIKLFCFVGDTVLDPFMGTGTTLVAARAMKRRAIGIEVEERFCAMAARTLQQPELL